MEDFSKNMDDYQVKWRWKNLKVKGEGKQNGVSRPWILPRSVQRDTWWRGDISALDEYLTPERGIKVHIQLGC